MKFSPLKRDIILLIVRDYEIIKAYRLIQAQLNVGAEQTFYIIDYLISQKLLNFDDGDLYLTNESHNLLRERKLDAFSLNKIEDYQFFVNEFFLFNYIPK